MASAKGQLQNTLTLCLKTELQFFCKYIHFRCNIFNFWPYFKSAKYFNIQMYDGQTIINDFLLPGQKLCANVTIIKFELV